MTNETKNIGYDIDFTNQPECSLENELRIAENELQILNEDIASIKSLKPECDKTDYALSVGCGVLCAFIDSFFVGSPANFEKDFVDAYFEKRVTMFAEKVKTKETKEKADFKDFSSVLRYLEGKFKIPYDQTGCGDAGKAVFDLNTKNHHFKSLGHNPTILGLVFSIWHQFSDTSSFVTDGELITLQKANDKFELRGTTPKSKFFCAFVNWFKHLISDASGSSTSKGRGTGIPSCITSWSNDIIAIKRNLNIPVLEFDKALNELALELYKNGHDFRFETKQAIPVFINEMLVRFLYSVRRLVQYFAQTPKEERSAKLMLKKCIPLVNPTVNRMLLVAHGTFCAADVTDAVVRNILSGSFDPVLICLRINLPGEIRFSILIFGEIRRTLKENKNEKNVVFLKQQMKIKEDYIESLKELIEQKKIDDALWDAFISNAENYIEKFNVSVKIAENAGVPEDRILKSKQETDVRFEKKDKKL